LNQTEQLAKKASRGCRASLELLISKHYRQVFAYAYRMLGDYHLAVDITQDTFVKMAASIGRYKSREKFIGWLLTIASNQVRDYWKSRLYRERQAPPLEEMIASSDETVEDLFTRNDRRSQVKKALQELSAEQREVIILRYYHDLKIDDIAEITRANPSTVKSRLRLGLMKLKTELTGGEENGTGQSRCKTAGDRGRN